MQCVTILLRTEDTTNGKALLPKLLFKSCTGFWQALGVSLLGVIRFDWLAALAPIYIGVCGLLCARQFC